MMSKKKHGEIERGDIFFYDFGERKGSIQSGARPVLVLQADDFNIHAPTILVAAITSVIKKKYLPSHIILSEGDVLPELSMVMLEQISTVNKCDLMDYMGTLTDERTWRRINAAVKKAFGMWRYNPEDVRKVRCLCQKHMKEYMDSGLYFVRRKDWADRRKDRCDKCENSGYDYIITEKNRKRGNDHGE